MSEWSLDNETDRQTDTHVHAHAHTDTYARTRTHTHPQKKHLCQYVEISFSNVIFADSLRDE